MTAPHPVVARFPRLTMMHARSVLQTSLIQSTKSWLTLQIGNSKYVVVPADGDGTDAARAEWIKIDDAFNSSAVSACGRNALAVNSEKEEMQAMRLR